MLREVASKTIIVLGNEIAFTLLQVMGPKLTLETTVCLSTLTKK